MFKGKNINLLFLITTFAIGTFFFLMLPFVVNAETATGTAGLVPCGLPFDDPSTTYNEAARCTLCHFFVLIDKVIKFLVKDILFPLAALMLIIGGGLYAAAFFEFLPGGPKTLEQAKQIFSSVAIGFLIIFAAYILVYLFFITIGVADLSNKFFEDTGFKINCELPTSTSANK